MSHSCLVGDMFQIPRHFESKWVVYYQLATEYLPHGAPLGGVKKFHHEMGPFRKRKKSHYEMGPFRESETSWAVYDHFTKGTF